MTHQFVETFSDYTAVLLRTDAEPGKEDRWITRSFLTCGFSEHENQEDMVFVHDESGVLVACDGDALAIYQANDATALRQCYSDLFTVMHNMEWRKVEVYTMLDSDELIGEMGAFIPAAYDLDMVSAVDDSQQSMLSSLRSDIEAQQDAQLQGQAQSSEPVLKMSDLLPAHELETSDETPTAAPAAAAAAGPASSTDENGESKELLRALVQGQQTMSQQFSDLMGFLGQVLQSQSPLKASNQDQAGDAVVAEPAVAVTAAAPVAAPVAPQPVELEPVLADVTTSAVGRIPAPPSDSDSDAALIGRIPAHPDQPETDVPEVFEKATAAHIGEKANSINALSALEDDQDDSVPVSLQPPAQHQTEREVVAAQAVAEDQYLLSPARMQMLKAMEDLMQELVSETISGALRVDPHIRKA